MEDERIIQIDGEDVVVTRAEARLKFISPPAVQSVASSPGDTSNTIFWKVPEHPDIVFASAILDTEGANKNWDYNPRPALASYFETAKFKPVDVEHIVKEDGSLILSGKTPRGKNTICGVIVDVQLSDSDGKILTTKELDKLEMSDDMSRKANDKLAVVCTLAFWSMLFPKTIADAVRNANKGELSVSMERWITSYDYLIRDGDVYKSVSKANGIKLGYHDKWAKRQMVNNSPILRRSLKFLYGGVAVTANPANSLCTFIEPELSGELAKASMDDPIIKNLRNSICQCRQDYLVELNEANRQSIVEKHLRMTKALATYLGWNGEK